MTGPFDASERSQQIWLRHQYVIIFAPASLQLPHLGRWVSGSVLCIWREIVSHISCKMSQYNKIIDIETGSTYILNLSEEDYLRASQKVKYFLNTLLSMGASRSTSAHWALSERLRFWMYPMVSNIQEARKEQQSSNRTNTVQHRERYEWDKLTFIQQKFIQQKFIHRYKCYKLVHLRSDCSIRNISGPTGA